jgi:hypothetical protein
MGWWGYGLFSGDSPADFIGNTEHWFRQQIEEAMKDGWRFEDVPAIIYLYADFCRRFGYRSKDMNKYVEWLRAYDASKNGWKSEKERQEAIVRLGNELEQLFTMKEKEGYRLDPSEYPRVNGLSGVEVYHLTRRENVTNIQKEGLLPKKCYAGWAGENKEGVFVSRSMLGCLKWQHHVLGHTLIGEPAIVKFAINDEDEVYQDQRVDFRDDLIVCNRIRPGRCWILS